MSFSVKHFPNLLPSKLFRLFTLSPIVVCSLTSVFLSNSQANATDIVDIKYQNTEVSVKTKDLKKFAETGKIPSHLQKFLDDTEQVPEYLSSLLTKEISISRSLIDDILDSSTGQFFLLKLNQTINSSSSTEDLEAIKKTVIKAYKNDKAVSIIELLDKYPQHRLRVDLTSLEGTYNDASTFTNKVLPAWEIAKSFMEDVVCDCEAK